MLLTEEQQVGGFMLLEHLAQQGAGSLEQMRKLRTLKDQMRPDNVQKRSEGLELQVKEKQSFDFSDEEIALLEEGVKLIDEKFQREDRRVPEWLACADEIVRRYYSQPDETDG
jgi:hypothetical protein